MHRSRANRRGSATLAGEDLEYLLKNIATNLSKRITRFYYYAYMGDRSFDTGLVKYYDPCPRTGPCKEKILEETRNKRPQLYDRLKAYTSP